MYKRVEQNKTIRTCRFKAKKLQIGEFIDDTDTMKHCMSDRLCVCVYACALLACPTEPKWRPPVTAPPTGSSRALHYSRSTSEGKRNNAQSSMHITFPFISAVQTLPPLQMASSDAPQQPVKTKKQNKKKSQREKYVSRVKTLVTLVMADSVGLCITRIFY